MYRVCEFNPCTDAPGNVGVNLLATLAQGILCDEKFLDATVHRHAKGFGL